MVLERAGGLEVAFVFVAVAPQPASRARRLGTSSG